MSHPVALQVEEDQPAAGELSWLNIVEGQISENKEREREKKSFQQPFARQTGEEGGRKSTRKCERERERRGGGCLGFPFAS